MKTNQVMIRKMGTFEVRQRTMDGMFNATDLLKQWNKSVGVKKEIKYFLRLEQTAAFLEVMENEENLNRDNPPYLATRGKQGGTWMHPILFTKFAMWINPRFEYFVIKFVYDELIKYRHSAGDQYRSLTRELAAFVNVDYARVAKCLNYIVFGLHAPQLRQNATQEQLKELANLQEKLAFAINMRYIKSIDELLNEMHKIYDMKKNYLR